jgi:hypothetical protein
MSQTFRPSSVFKPQPPPLWYVTNGDLTVGPVVTDLLMRGVEYGRVPEDCHVRAFRGAWRALTSVREIAAINSGVGMQPPSEDQLAEWTRPLERIRDEHELCHMTTWLTLAATGAESAMFHYRDRYTQSLVTRSIQGATTNDRLGFALSQYDLVLRAAQRGRPVVGAPEAPTEEALALRFSETTDGIGAVAMIPIFVGDTLTAMLELARPGHVFRHGDLKRAELIVQRALHRRLN